MASISLDASKWNGLMGLQFAIERIMAIVRRAERSDTFFIAVFPVSVSVVQFPFCLSLSIALMMLPHRVHRYR
jgi:hypothetical protein